MLALVAVRGSRCHGIDPGKAQRQHKLIAGFVALVLGSACRRLFFSLRFFARAIVVHAIAIAFGGSISTLV
jgi:hypothetical protein